MYNIFKIETEMLSIRKDDNQKENFAKLDVLFNLSKFDRSGSVNFMKSYHEYLSRFVYKGLVPETAEKQNELMFKWLGIDKESFKVEISENANERTYVLHRKSKNVDQTFDFLYLLLRLLDLDNMYKYDPENTHMCAIHECIGERGDDNVRSHLLSLVRHGDDGKSVLGNTNELAIKA